MADDDTLPEPTDPPSGKARGWLFLAGFLITGLIGLALALVAFQNQAPLWVGLIAFFAPPALYFLVSTSVFFARITRQAREEARNAPSPESVAAAAGGEGVEAGAEPELDTCTQRDDTPTVLGVETTPGKVLTHRLARSGLAPGCEFGCAVGIAVFWNAIVGFFLYKQFAAWNAVGGGFFGGWRWLSAVFLIPFVIIGLAMIGYALYAGLRWIVAGLVGSVEVELSAHPLTPGGPARVHVSQRGMFPLARVFVRLVCTEEATYVAGTSKSSAKKEVVTHTMADPDQNPDGGLPLEAAFTVPTHAMHSFAAPNNQINWTVRVSGRVLGLPFTDDYGVTVAPD